jgi:hypothetical protein
MVFSNLCKGRLPRTVLKIVVKLGFLFTTFTFLTCLVGPAKTAIDSIARLKLWHLLSLRRKSLKGLARCV